MGTTFYTGLSNQWGSLQLKLRSASNHSRNVFSIFDEVGVDEEPLLGAKTDKWILTACPFGNVKNCQHTFKEKKKQRAGKDAKSDEFGH